MLVWYFIGITFFSSNRDGILTFAGSTQKPPHVSRATWSVFRLVDLIKPRNSSSDTARIKRALIKYIKENSSTVMVVYYIFSFLLHSSLNPTWQMINQYLCQLLWLNWPIIPTHLLVAMQDFKSKFNSPSEVKANANAHKVVQFVSQ